MLLLDEIEAAQLHERMAAGLVRRHAGPQVVVDLKLEVGVQFIRDVAVVRAPAPQPGDSQKRRSPSPHAMSSGHSLRA